MTSVFVCADFVVNASILPLLYRYTRSHSWWDSMGCHCLQYMVTPSIDPWHHMPSQRYVHDNLQLHVLPLMQKLPGAIFQQENVQPRTARVSQDCLHTFTTLSWPAMILRFVFNQAYLESFGTPSWPSHEFERTRGNITSNMELNVSRHHIELVCLIARSYRIVHSC
ncbi:uncharacterized protein TNCV_2210301 [Trichonephila clavipes]|nr:uncharacterized protein TNCV_2210301 [Trichonephila clavipes]